MRHDPAGAAIVIMLRSLKMVWDGAGGQRADGTGVLRRLKQRSPFSLNCSRPKCPNAKCDPLPIK